MALRKTTVLVVDDEPQIRRLIERSLRVQGYAIIEASDGEAALDQMITLTPDLLIIDLMMPGMDGFEVIERIRRFSQVPILILTAIGQDEEKVRGLDLGADDYMTKPFNLDELAARIRSALRRSQQESATNSAGQSVVTVGALQIDFVANQATIQQQAILLTPMEFRLLAMLARHPGRVITQDTLLKEIWGPEYTGENHLLQVGINRLRRKIEQDPNHPQYVLTHFGVGYLLATHETRSCPAEVV